MSLIGTLNVGKSALAVQQAALQDTGLRQIVLQNGDAVAGSFQSLRNQLSGLQSDAGDRITALANDADQLADQIADLNQQIVNAEGGKGDAGGGANGLRDRRDAL